MTIKNLQLKTIQKGFTLVELLVVIAILGILAVGLIAAINPLDKLNAASDARVISDLGVIARAAESYSTTNSGNYPNALTVTAFGNELKNIPSKPAGYGDYTLTALPAACTTACTSFTITGQLKSSKYSATPVAKYESATGKQCQTTGTWSAANPPVVSGVGSC